MIMLYNDSKYIEFAKTTMTNLLRRDKKQFKIFIEIAVHSLYLAMKKYHEKLP